MEMAIFEPRFHGWRSLPPCCPSSPHLTHRVMPCQGAQTRKPLTHTHSPCVSPRKKKHSHDVSSGCIPVPYNLVGYTVYLHYLSWCVLSFSACAYTAHTGPAGLKGARVYDIQITYNIQDLYNSPCLLWSHVARKGEESIDQVDHPVGRVIVGPDHLGIKGLISRTNEGLRA